MTARILIRTKPMLEWVRRPINDMTSRSERYQLVGIQVVDIQQTPASAGWWSLTCDEGETGRENRRPTGWVFRHRNYRSSPPFSPTLFIQWQRPSEPSANESFYGGPLRLGRRARPLTRDKQDTDSNYFLQVVPSSPVPPRPLSILGALSFYVVEQWESPRLDRVKAQRYVSIIDSFWPNKNVFANPCIDALQDMLNFIY